MRKIILSGFIAFSAFGAAHASVEPVSFASAASAPITHEKNVRAESRSALSTIMERFLNAPASVEEGEIIAATDRQGAEKQCPQNGEELSAADDKSEDKKGKSQPIGPEPIYFAF